MCGSPERETRCRSLKREGPLNTKRAMLCSKLHSMNLSMLFLGLALIATQRGFAQQPQTWDQVKAKFEAVNPALKADADNVDEMHAEEITAFLRPNPQFNFAVDGNQ